MIVNLSYARNNEINLGYGENLPLHSDPEMIKGVIHMSKFTLYVHLPTW